MWENDHSLLVTKKVAKPSFGGSEIVIGQYVSTALKKNKGTHLTAILEFLS